MKTVAHTTVCRLILIFFLSGSMLQQAKLLAQEFDYHRVEAPAISWNDIALYDARALACGGISLMAAAPFAGAVNPAAMPKGEKKLFGLSGYSLRHEAFQFWGFNEGVIKAPNGFSEQNYGPGGLALFLPLHSIRLTLGWRRTSLPRFPKAEHTIVYNYGAYTENVEYAANFSGSEDSFFIAVAKAIGLNGEIGLKLDYASGRRTVAVTETDYDNWYTYYRLSQGEKHNWRYLTATAGIKWTLAHKWDVGAYMAYPFRGKSRNSLERIYEIPLANMNISQSASSSDPFYRPIKTGASIRHDFILAGSQEEPRLHLTMASEALLSFWSGYKYVFLSESLPRDMRSTLSWGIGGELGLPAKRSEYFLRAGFRLDPQPVKDPAVTLKVFTFGLGVFGKSVQFDFGGVLFSGGTAEFQQGHTALIASLTIGKKGDEK